MSLPKLGSVDLNNEILSFNINIKGNLGFTNSIRREILSGLRLLRLNLVRQVKNDIIKKKYEDFERFFNFLYVDHNILNDNKDFSNVKFILKLKFTKGHIVKTDMIKFFNGKKLIESPVRQDLVIFKAENNGEIELYGNIIRDNVKPVSVIKRFFDGDNETAEKFFFEISMLEILSPYELMKRTIQNLIDKLNRFKNNIEEKIFPIKYSDLSVDYTTPKSKYGYTIMVMLCDEILNNTLSGYENYMACYREEHPHNDKFYLRVMGESLTNDLADEIIIKYVDVLIKKFVHLGKGIEKKMRGSKFMKVIKDY
jgi:DNA-directed RNA polymerase subunit L